MNASQAGPGTVWNGWRATAAAALWSGGARSPAYGKRFFAAFCLDGSGSYKWEIAWTRWRRSSNSTPAT